MAITCFPSVIPTVAFGCDCYNAKSCVLVQDGDISKIQVGLSPVNSVNLLTNGDFVSGGTGWTTTGVAWTFPTNTAQWNNSGSAGNIEKDLDVPLEIGYYLVQFDIVNDLLTGSAILEAYLGNELMGGVSGYMEAQTVKIYSYISAPANDRVMIRLGSANPITIDNIIVQRMSEPTWELRDCDTEDVLYSGSATTYFETGSIPFGELQIEGYFDDVQPIAQINIAWSPLTITHRCYCLCIKDQGTLVDNIRNGAFADTSIWEIDNVDGVGWEIAGGVAEHDASGAAGADVIQQDLPTLISECEYDLTFTYDGIGGHIITVLYDTATTTDNILTTYATDNAPHTVTFSLPSTATVIKFSVPARGGLSNTTLDNISLTISDLDCVPCTCQSVCISFKAVHALPDMCNILITAYNDTNGGPYNFEDFTFQHTLRVYGKFRQPNYTYPNEEYYPYSNGVTIRVNADLKKVKLLQVYRIREEIYDILSQMLIHDHVFITIDGETVEHVKRPGSLQPSWSKRSDDAPVTIELMERTQNYYYQL